MTAHGFWTAERVDWLRRRWQDGASAGVIGKEMGATRSAVLGKAHRIDLPMREQKNELPKKKRTRAKIAAPTKSSQPAGLSRPVRIFALKSEHCRWPLWDDKSDHGLYCGAQVSWKGGPYCAFHARVSAHGYPVEKSMRQCKI